LLGFFSTASMISILQRSCSSQLKTGSLWMEAARKYGILSLTLLAGGFAGPKEVVSMSMFQRPAPPTWKILLYCFGSLAVLLLLGRIAAIFQIG